MFSQKGFHDAKIEDVALEAGIGKGTVYLYFSSKQELLEEIYRYAIQQYVAAIKALAGGEGSTRAKLEAIIAHALGMAHMSREVARFVIEGATGMREEFKVWAVGVKEENLGIIRGMLEIGIQSGELGPVDQQIWAHIIVGTINSLVARALWAPGLVRAEPRELARTVAGQLWSGLGPRDQEEIAGDHRNS